MKHDDLFLNHIDLEIVWKTIRVNIPGMKNKIQAYLQNKNRTE
jgi:uncharacterized protein with HEPN domain